MLSLSKHAPRSCSRSSGALPLSLTGIEAAMTAYQAPLADMAFVLGEVVGLSGPAAPPGLAEVTPDLIAAVLGEAGRLAGGVLAPLNASGDREGSRLEN